MSLFDAWLREEIKDAKAAIIRDKAKPRNTFEAVIHREANEQIERDRK